MDPEKRSYAPAAISVLIVFGFFVVLLIWLTRPIPNMTDGMVTALNILIGSLGTAFGQVLQYWLGSSAGSKEKDRLLADIGKGAASPTS